MQRIFLSAYENAPDFALSVAGRRHDDHDDDDDDNGDETATTAEVFQTREVGWAVEEDPVEIRARIARGDMHFEDFWALHRVMSNSGGFSGGGPIRDIPGGFEAIIESMTPEERFDPQLFRTADVACEDRISRIASAVDIDRDYVATFLTDFGTIQSFFSKVSGAKSKKGIVRELTDEAAEAAVEHMADKPRKARRKLEQASPLYKEVNAKKRSKTEKGFR